MSEKKKLLIEIPPEQYNIISEIAGKFFNNNKAKFIRSLLGLFVDINENCGVIVYDNSSLRLLKNFKETHQISSDEINFHVQIQTTMEDTENDKTE